MKTPPPDMPSWSDVRAQFPALGREVHGRPVLFADNASTSLKPTCVIEAVTHYYTRLCANVHRGVSLLSQEADGLYEGARGAVAELIGAHPDEIVFVRNTTEAINLAAHLLRLGPDDEIVCSVGDHHSNLLPWSSRATVRPVAIDAEGRLQAASVRAAIGPKTRLVTVAHASNVTGIVAPVADIVAVARAAGVATLVDAAQSVAHLPIDVRTLECDFLAFSGHKMFGPSGVGVLYGRRALLEAGTPMLFGGGMVTKVTSAGIDLERVPHRYEAGTPNIEGALGLGAAARFLMSLGMDRVREHGKELSSALCTALGRVRGITTYPARWSGDRIPVASFAAAGISADDLATMLSNRHGIMVRSGAHCAQPLVEHFGERSLLRVSLCLYNTPEEARRIAEAVDSICRMFVTAS